MEQARGIILRLTKLTETSLIVTWCVEGYGLVKAVAKGARRPKSAFTGKLDLFHSAELQWTNSQRSELGTLGEVSAVTYREGLRKYYANVVCAAYFTALVEHVMEPGHGEDGIYDLLERGLNYLDQQEAEMRALLHFERELAKLLGVWSGKGRPEVALQMAFQKLPASRQQCVDLLSR
ncbi:DNA repair protein RecO (recombination protein O) [Rubritalea squalenifaciens DSM 18772]|uniref:DNA repair protein RecO n=1 Tax=Rubritalea squalenifaciens DSM 18772 TaxID=1123071 RepID=A0A1M6KSK8_9BACT|nr:DNA repair protein RecO [Rubritalea squalenifaciens]SHJ61864.1 DNA repair protein RecO (recombination protein O) [Rubritalea squalenifaciens DSM 18772]